MSLDFPRPRIAALHALGARLLDSRKVGTPLETLARDLLAGFHDICMASGLDGIPAALGVDDRGELADHPQAAPALVAQLRAVDIDGGGPRNAKPGQIADSVVAALGLTLVDDAEPPTTLDDAVRAELAAALASVLEPELAAPRLRARIIAEARSHCDEHHHTAFDRLADQLDERGMRILKQPKLPLDAVQATQRLLAGARATVIGAAARTAIDRALPILARADAAAAARLDRPVTHRLTPREVAIARACDERVLKTPAGVQAALLDALSELSRIAWRAPERTARTYSPRETFAVGELIDHPKFGRGSVVARQAQRIEVEFADGKHTLVHLPPK